MRRGVSSLAFYGIIAASILGVVLAHSIPSSVFPEIQFNRAIILADSGDLPASQMLVGVTRPLEQAAYGVMNVAAVRSATIRGSSEMDVIFAEQNDAVSSFQLLNNAIS